MWAKKTIFESEYNVCNSVAHSKRHKNVIVLFVTETTKPGYDNGSAPWSMECFVKIVTSLESVSNEYA